MDQVNLSQVWLCWIGAYAGKVLHLRSGVDISLDAKARNHADLAAGLLRKAVLAGTTNRDDAWSHAQLIQRVAIGRALSLASPIGSPHWAQLP